MYRQAFSEAPGPQIWLMLVRVYTNGFEIELKTTFGRVVRPTDTDDVLGLRKDRGGLRVGLASSGVGEVDRLSSSVSAVERDQQGIPLNPVVLVRGALLQSCSLDLRLWCWPLPEEAGVVSLYLDWEDYGLKESSVLLRGSLIVEASRSAVEA